jgi:hypothetical protein
MKATGALSISTTQEGSQIEGSRGQVLNRSTSAPGGWLFLVRQLERALTTYASAVCILYSAPVNNSKRIDTCNETTNHDPKLSVLTGLECGALECVEGNDNGCGLHTELLYLGYRVRRAVLGSTGF